MTLRLRQLQVLHRHGDRTPLVNVFCGSRDARAEQEEVLLWSRELPAPAQLARLREAYSVHLGDGAQASVQRRPFGYLTTTGIQQMTARGDRLREFCEQEELALRDVKPSEVQIFSNTYTRTQLSAQALLRGLLRDQPELMPSVGVFPPETDIINTYAAFPEISELKQELERDDATFAAREHEMLPCKQELLRLLPVFKAERHPFTWMAATDYFMCRQAHKLPFIPGTEEHCEAAERHLSFRFQQFYSHRTILKLVAGRLMHNVLRELQAARYGRSESKKLVIYSGHDVSLLSVLHVVDAELKDDLDWWPGYSAALALELLEDDSGRFFVRVRLNGDALAMRGAPHGLHALEDFQELVANRIGQRMD